MMFFLLGLAAGWAQSQPSTMALEITVDDHEQGRLSAPAVELVGESARWPMRDDGALPGDVANDGVWVVALDIAQTDTFDLWAVQPSVKSLDGSEWGLRPIEARVFETFEN